MTAKHTIPEHHATAATHHAEAARFHRQASKHFETGEDPEHWAHQALLAHGHTLCAIESGNIACRFYASHGVHLPSKYSDRVVQFPSNALETAQTMGTILDGFQRHAVAADHHEEAAKHHGRASKHCLERNYSPAFREAQLATHHAQQSLFQSHEAAKQRVEDYFDLLLPNLSNLEQAGKVLA
jgi:hypothetical protein